MPGTHELPLLRLRAASGAEASAAKAPPTLERRETEESVCVFVDTRIASDNRSGRTKC